MADSQGNDPPDLRQTFEQHGIGTMQTLLAAPDRPFVHQGQPIDANRVRVTCFIGSRSSTTGLRERKHRT